MAQVIGPNQVKLNDGRVVAAQQGGWYDAQQYWGGTLSNPGVINSQSNQVGAGQRVSDEVLRQTSVAAGKAPEANKQYIESFNANPGNSGAGYGADFGGGMDAGGGGAGLGLGSLTGGGASLNLPDLYKNLSAEAGIEGIQENITKKTKGYNDAISKINDNPYLAEANRTGKLEKLRIDFNNDIKNDQDSLAMKKQDIQTQLDLQTKQFDINSQQAKFALDQFNTLLSSGALAGASGADVAAITKATGISSSMIQAAIKSQAVKDRQTSVTTVDDGKNIYSVVIDSKTGQIIAKQSIGASKPPAASGGEAKIGSASYKASSLGAINQFISTRANSYGHISPTDWNNAKQAFIQDGLGTAKDFVSSYSAYADPNRGDFSKAYGFNLD